MSTTDRVRFKSKYKYVFGVRYGISSPTFWIFRKTGVAEMRFTTEREAAIAADTYLINHGQKPVNVLVKVPVVTNASDLEYIQSKPLSSHEERLAIAVVQKTRNLRPITNIERVLKGNYIPFYEYLVFKDIEMYIGPTKDDHIMFVMKSTREGRSVRCDAKVSVAFLAQTKEPLAHIASQFERSYQELLKRG